MAQRHEWENTLDKLDQINLAKFRKMLQESGNELLQLIEIEIEDEILLRLIRRPDVNLRASLKTLINIVKARFSLPFAVIIDKGYPSEVRHVFTKRIFGVLKKRDKLGRQVLWFKLSRWNPNEVPEYDLFRAMVILGWEILASKVTQIKGIVGILDAAGCSLTHVHLATPIKIQMYLKLFLKCNPFHIGGCHIINAPAVFHVAFSIFKSFLPSQYKKMLHVHSKSKKLLEYVPAGILPNFLGGVFTEDNTNDDSVIENLFQKDKYYKKLIQIGKGQFYSRQMYINEKEWSF